MRGVGNFFPWKSSPCASPRIPPRPDKSKFELEIPACAAGIVSDCDDLSEGLFDLFKTSLAYSFAVKEHDVVRIVAEYA